MPTLDDLPPYRRAKLLWDYAHFGVYRVEQIVRDEAGKPCGLSGVPVPASPRVAILGSDGRRHLMSDGQLICAERASKRGWEHQQLCFWGETPEGPVEDHRDGETYQSIERRWLVQALDEGVPPDSVPPEQRCQGGLYGGFHYWPPPRPRRRRSVGCAPLWSKPSAPTATCATPCRGQWSITTTRPASCGAC
ncbi:hypothetical protein [Streptomyces ureilyticus]|uniref:hypothetical protein n=1 Tax=Streptomyces ureilyticus TaxID=1775131 RepID=UPI001F256D1E|nr:hypothetical protein [Streptomyces ureilyticus]